MSNLLQIEKSTDNEKINTYYISRVTTDNVRCVINKTGKAIFRTFSDDDIGTDGIVELIKLDPHRQISTGRIAFVQFKGTANKISPLKTSPEISVKIKHTTLEYIRDVDSIPVILIYSSLEEEKNFYFCDIRKTFGDNLKTELERNIDEHCVRIPIKNNFLENPEEFFKIINPNL